MTFEEEGARTNLFESVVWVGVLGRRMKQCRPMSINTKLEKHTQLNRCDISHLQFIGLCKIYYYCERDACPSMCMRYDSLDSHIP